MFYKTKVAVCSEIRTKHMLLMNDIPVGLSILSIYFM
jgi:hypothetical protein